MLLRPSWALAFTALYRWGQDPHPVATCLHPTFSSRLPGELSGPFFLECCQAWLPSASRPQLSVIPALRGSVRRSD